MLFYNPSSILTCQFVVTIDDKEYDEIYPARVISNPFSDREKGVRNLSLGVHYN